MKFDPEPSKDFKLGYMLLFGYIMGILSNDDGSENVAKKKTCQSRLFVPLNMSNVSDLSWS